MRPLALVAALAAAALTTPLRADVTALTPFPAKLAIRGSDDAPQLLVTGTDGPRERDLTATVAYAVSDPKVARVDAAGRVFPLANGAADITATFQGKTTKVPVTVAGLETFEPINFTNTIEPILTKLSCNSGGCHGKIQGQNNFRLSLLGYDPELDFATLTKESRGRRMLPSAPDQSLFLLKTTGQIPHGGGKKTEVGSEEYKVLRRWIASGTPFGRPTDPTIVKVTVSPETRVIDRSARQQLAVHAHYSDGRVEDVTRRAQYESNETEVATVNETGLVNTLTTTGQVPSWCAFRGWSTSSRRSCRGPVPPSISPSRPKPSSINSRPRSGVS